MWIRINCGRHWIKKCKVVQSQVFGSQIELECRNGEDCIVPYDEVIEIGDTVAFKRDTGNPWQSWGKSIKIDSDEAMASVINMIQTELALEELCG